MYDKVRNAASVIAKMFETLPSMALVLGTGFDPMLSDMEIRKSVDFKDIPHFPASNKRGRCILAVKQGLPIFIVEGRLHYYEGYTMEGVTFPIRMMQVLGIKHIVFTNASGSVNPHFDAGDIIAIKDHINLLPEHPLRGHNDERFGVRFPDMIDAYDIPTIDDWVDIGRHINIEVKTGVYLALQGPSLETPEEYRMARLLGADIVGMSTLPEVIVARHSGIKVTACSIVSNICYPADRLVKTDIASIIATVHQAVDKVDSIFSVYCRKLAGE